MNVTIKVENQEIALNFQKVEVVFGEEDETVFRRYSKKTWKEILLDKNYKDLAEQGLSDNPKYSDYVNEPIGIVLKKLKEQKDPIYLSFLLWANDIDSQGKATRVCVGDLKYVKYWIKKTEISQNVGLYVYCVDNQIRYVGVCEKKKVKNDFLNRINNGYGNISPRNTLRKGQAPNCRINAKVRENKSQISIWLCPLDKNLPLLKYEIALIKKLTTEGLALWNTKLPQNC
jgi:hypothetical protein